MLSSSGLRTAFKVKFCKMVVRNKNISMRARPSPGHIRFPAEKGMKSSLFLKVPFSFKKCPGLNSCGFGNSLLLYSTELRTGKIVVPLGMKCSLK